MPPVTLSEDWGFDFALRCLLSGVGYDMAEPGEVLAVADAVVAGDRDSWFDTLTAMADRCRAAAESAAEAATGGDRRRSVATASLREANYRYAAFYHVLGTSQPDRQLPAWRAHRRALDRALDHWPTPVERSTVTVDVGGTSVMVPLWLFTPGGPPPAPGWPVVVVHNLLTAPLSDVLMTGVTDAVERGWAAAAFEGPGQGTTWFEDGVGPTADWPAVATAVADRLVADPRIDGRRLVAMGVGDGGYLAARSAAADHRVAALVCDPGVLRPVAAALGQLPEGLQSQWEESGWDEAGWKEDSGRAFDQAVAEAAAGDHEVAFTVAKLIEQWPTSSLAAVLGEMAAWDLAPHVDRITCPTWIADPDNATSFPGQSAELAGLLGARGTLVRFTSAEGAGLDCEIGAPRLRNQRVYDWLDDRLR